MGTEHWTCGDWQYEVEMSALDGQAEENRAVALKLAAEDVGSGKNEAGVPARFRTEVAEYLALRAKAEGRA